MVAKRSYSILSCVHDPQIGDTWLELFSALASTGRPQPLLIVTFLWILLGEDKYFDREIDW